MPCYHPLIGKYTGELTENGKRKFLIEGNLDPLIAKEIYPGSVVIPCGKCLGCRLDYSRQWADRMLLELETTGSAVFLTLTYDNEHATCCKSDDFGNDQFYTLVKKDFQDFMKRLRASKLVCGKKLRFYAAGEYGDNTFRPHYHVILFGLSLADISDLQNFGRNELGQTHYISDSIRSIWSHGFVLVSDVSWNTFAYVSRYVTKKAMSTHLVSEMLNQMPEFSLMSRKPGIGRFYLDEHPDCFEYQSIVLSDKEGSKKVNIPKYFVKQLELTDPERADIIRSQRKEYANDRMMLKLMNTDLSYLDQLEVEENNKIKKMSALKRRSI